MVQAIGAFLVAQQQSAKERHFLPSQVDVFECRIVGIGELHFDLIEHRFEHRPGDAKSSAPEKDSILDGQIGVASF